MSIPPPLTPVEVNLLAAADETAEEHKTAVVGAAEHAAACMRVDMLPRTRRWLTTALRELDALEERLTQLREQR